MKIKNCNTCSDKDCGQNGKNKESNCMYYREMEKIIVRGLRELRKYRAGKVSDFLNYNGLIILASCKVELIVKAFNSVGGNFEYKPVEVIDTLKKWEEFQKMISSDGILYDRDNNDFVDISSDKTESGDWYQIQTEKIESKYNVDLQILKEGE